MDRRPSLRQPKVYSPPKEQKSFVFPKWLKIVILIIIGLAALGYFLFYSPFFKIKNIEIIGNPPEEARYTIDSVMGQNIFFLKVGNLENDLIKQNRQFSQIKVYRGIPDTVRVKFEEREAKIIWTTQGKQFLVDKSGIIFKENDGVTGLPIVIDNKNLTVAISSSIASSNFIDFVRSANLELTNQNLKPTQFEVNETTFQINAITSTIKIMFNILRPLSDQIDALSKVYPQHQPDIKEYIDLRVEGFVYYK